MARRVERPFIVSERWDNFILDWLLILAFLGIFGIALVQVARWAGWMR